MRSHTVNRLLGRYVLSATIAVTLFVSPWYSLDPVNLPKLVLLGISGIVIVTLGFSGLAFTSIKDKKWLLIVLGLFIATLTTSLISSPSDFSFKFYGSPGRNTGYLAYISLAFIAFGSAIASSIWLMKKMVISLLSMGALLAIYGLAQWRGADFFDYVNVYGSDVFGTFGNPNFQSAFMGMVAATSMTWAIFGKPNIKIRGGLLVLAALALLNVKLSSEQGFLNFIAGLAGAIAIYLFATGKRFLCWSFIAGLSMASTVLIMGMFNFGPLADAIYKSSLQARGFYWRAGINMMTAHPIFGIGPDGFGNWYRRSRTQSAAEFNTGIVSDSAHNLPLDLGTAGGFPLMIAYMGFVLLTITSVVRILKRGNEFDAAFASIVAAWIAYQAQSLISINQLGLGVWGWALMGLLIGYEINTRKENQTVRDKSVQRNVKPNDKIPASVLLATIGAGIIGFMISLPPYLTANKYYRAIQAADARTLQEAAYLKPYDRTRFLYTAQIMASNKLDSQAIAILEDAAVIYPDNFELWQQWFQIPSATADEKAKALAEMKRLDPFNLGLK